MNRALSASSRPKLIHDLEAGTFDLVIIGGGITGAGIAWDAAKRGLKAVLIEQGDFASGTSSRSTKLIHGGLRYLKKGEVRLVKEVGREREWLYGSAPHLLTPVPMLLPLYKGGTFGYLSASLGLAVYDRLAGVLKQERRVMLRAGKAAKQEPLLKGEGLKGGGLYYEYRSDDARLTVEVLKTAARHGALAINYMQAADFLYYKSRVCGVKAIDRLTGLDVEIRAKRVVNAAGPWVDLVRAKDHAIRGKTLLLTKGIHLVVSHSKLPVKQAAYFDVADGRMIFVIPRGKKTYIGTTDTVYNGDPNQIRVTESDRDYLLKAVTEIFPRVKLSEADVEAMWAGLRPLIHQEGKSPSDISRKDEVWESPSGLITIAGGKLTGFRKMAEKTVDAITASIASESRQTYAPCTTDREMISGGDCGRCETYEDLREQLLAHGVKRGLTAKAVNELLDRYGSNISKIYMRLAELDAGFRNWKLDPPAAKKSAAPEQGRRSGTEWTGVEESGRGRKAHAESGGDRADRRDRADTYRAGRADAPDRTGRADGADGLGRTDRADGADRVGRTDGADKLKSYTAAEAGGAERGRAAGAGERSRTEYGVARQPETGAAAPRTEESSGRNSSLGRKPATPENGKINAGERAAWIEEWNKREQKAAAASNAEERARWIREWNQKKRLSEGEEAELAGGAPETGSDRITGEKNPLAEAREEHAAPQLQESAAGYGVEDAWRQLEELTGLLRHEQPEGLGKAAAEQGNYEKAAPESSHGRNSNESLHLRRGEEAWDEASRQQDEPWQHEESYSSGGAEELAGRNEGWDDRDGGPEWSPKEADARWSGTETQAEAEWDDGTEPIDGWAVTETPGESEAPGVMEAAPGVQHGMSSQQENQEEQVTGEGLETDESGYFNTLEYKLLKAEVQYCVEEEMAVNAADFLIRRTGLLYFDRERAEEIAIDVIEIMAELLDWSEQDIVDQKLQLAKEWELATTAYKWETD